MPGKEPVYRRAVTGLQLFRRVGAVDHDNESRFRVSEYAFPINGSVFDDCSTNVSGADTVYFNVTNQETGQSYRCPSGAGNANPDPSLGGFFYCDWETNSTMPIGWYTVEMRSAEPSYNDGYATKTFFLTAAPTLSASSVYPTSGGWGRVPYNYSVYATDPENDTVTVRLWRNDTTGWVSGALDVDTCANCDNTLIDFQKQYACGDIGNWTFKFNATDIHGNAAETSESWHYVDKDAVSAGAYISMATDAIYFSPNGVMGAAAVVSGSGEDIQETMKAKVRRPIYDS